MEDPRITFAQFNFPKMAYYNVLINTRAEQGLKRIETLWMNYDAGEGQMELII